MTYPFTGSDTRIYSQYRDLATDRTLVASPGGSYDMAPAGQYGLPVPPGDGNWGRATTPPPPDAPAPAPDPPAEATAPKPASKPPATGADAPQGAV